MNKQEFYNAFKKGVTCAITCLIIFFSALFCFYTGYNFGRERVLDRDPVDVSSFVQTQSLHTAGLDYGIGDDAIPIPYLDLSNIDLYLSKYNSTEEWHPTAGSACFPINFHFEKTNFSLTVGNYSNGRFDYVTNSGSLIFDTYSYLFFDFYGIGEYVKCQYFMPSDFDFSSFDT